MPVTPNSIVTPQAPKLGLVQLTTADLTGSKNCFVAGANGSKVVSLICSSTDVAARPIRWGVLRGGLLYSVVVVNVPAGAGLIAGIPSVDLLTPAIGLPIDNDGQPYLFLQSGDILQSLTFPAISGAGVYHFASVGYDF